MTTRQHTLSSSRTQITATDLQEPSPGAASAAFERGLKVLDRGYTHKRVKTSKPPSPFGDLPVSPNQIQAASIATFVPWSPNMPTNDLGDDADLCSGDGGSSDGSSDGTYSSDGVRSDGGTKYKPLEDALEDAELTFEGSLFEGLNRSGEVKEVEKVYKSKWSVMSEKPIFKAASRAAADMVATCTYEDPRATDYRIKIDVKDVTQPSREDELPYPVSIDWEADITKHRDHKRRAEFPLYGTLVREGAEWIARKRENSNDEGKPEGTGSPASGCELPETQW